MQDFRNVIEKKDRCSAGLSVPAQALFLEEVEYESGKLRVESFKVRS